MIWCKQQATHEWDLDLQCSLNKILISQDANNAIAGLTEGSFW